MGVAFLSSSRLLPGTQEWLVAGVLLVFGADVAGTAFADDPGISLPVLAARGAGLVVLVVLLRARARSIRREDAVWSRMSVGALTLAAGTLLSAVLTALPVPGQVAGQPAGWAPLLAFPWFYGALVRWNRTSTSLADPNDVLNGFSAVLAVIAVLVPVVGGGSGRGFFLL